MTKLTLTKTRLFAGVWQGELTGAGSDRPDIRVTHLGDTVEGVNLTHDPDQKIWNVSIPIPSRLISDGVQTFIISDRQGNVLDSFMLLSGEALAEDIRAEVALLRSELEMLKQSFRRHCNDS